MLPHMHPSHAPLGVAEKCLLIAGHPRELNPAADLFTIAAAGQGKGKGSANTTVVL